MSGGTGGTSGLGANNGSTSCHASTTLVVSHSTHSARCTTSSANSAACAGTACITHKGMDDGAAGFDTRLVGIFRDHVCSYGCVCVCAFFLGSIPLTLFYYALFHCHLFIRHYSIVSYRHAAAEHERRSCLGRCRRKQRRSMRTLP